MPIVADASPLILLARAGLLDLLRHLYGEAWVPPRVSGEAFGDHPTRPGAIAIAQSGGWLREVAPVDQDLVALLRTEVHAGEAEAIALAMEHRLLLLIDDHKGRRSARARHVDVIGSAGILSVAKASGLLTAIRPALDRLMDEGLWLSSSLYRQVLTDAGE